mmetsp:Transcript_4360/g.676  ORF Transcript_4360/g.676 Transcript_4360/m.676 type:complete len:140 (-) Transcript_4360:432-851(-)
MFFMFFLFFFFFTTSTSRSSTFSGSTIFFRGSRSSSITTSVSITTSISELILLLRSSIIIIISIRISLERVIELSRSGSFGNFHIYLFSINFNAFSIRSSTLSNSVFEIGKSVFFRFSGDLVNDDVTRCDRTVFFHLSF